MVLEFSGGKTWAGKKIETERTLRFYGIARNAKVHLCGRLLGGKTDTLENYVSDNGENFSVEVTLPDGNVSLDMTKLGCLILLTP
uniref:Ubiquitin-like domain-containing protein n=1 Tax=Setaria italica TaxID=4555 RepID=K3YX90_SETIT